MCICVYKSDNAGGQYAGRWLAGAACTAGALCGVGGTAQVRCVGGTAQVHCVGGTAGGFHFQTEMETSPTESANLFKKLFSIGLFTYTI